MKSLQYTRDKLESEASFFSEVFHQFDIKRESCIHCIVTEYDREKNCVSLQPLPNRMRDNGKEVVSSKRPVLSKIPVLGFSHGGFKISSPIFVGDTGYLIAADRNCSKIENSNSTVLYRDDSEQEKNTGADNPDDLSLTAYTNGFFIPCSWAKNEPSFNENGDLIIEGIGRYDGDGNWQKLVLSNDGHIYVEINDRKLTLGKNGLMFEGVTEAKAPIISGVRISEDGVFQIKRLPAERSGNMLVKVEDSSGEDEWTDVEGSENHNPGDGEDGVGIKDITAGTPSQSNGYTVTPITVTKTDDSEDKFNVRAKNGADGKDAADFPHPYEVRWAPPDSNVNIGRWIIWLPSACLLMYNDTYIDVRILQAANGGGGGGGIGGVFPNPGNLPAVGGIYQEGWYNISSILGANNSLYLNITKDENDENAVPTTTFAKQADGDISILICDATVNMATNVSSVKQSVTSAIFIGDNNDGSGGDGVGIESVVSGDPIPGEDEYAGYTITPVTVTKTDGTQDPFDVYAKNGEGGSGSIYIDENKNIVGISMDYVMPGDEDFANHKYAIRFRRGYLTINNGMLSVVEDPNLKQFIDTTPYSLESSQGV